MERNIPNLTSLMKDSYLGIKFTFPSASQRKWEIMVTLQLKRIIQKIGRKLKLRSLIFSSPQCISKHNLDSTELSFSTFYSPYDFVLR